MGGRRDAGAPVPPPDASADGRIARGARLLPRMVPDLAPPDAAWNPRVLDRRTGERVVVEYRAVPGRGLHGRGPARVVGKLYGDDTGARTYRVMRALAAALQRHSAEGPLAIPAAMGWDARERLLALQYVPGVPYTRLVEGRQARRHFRLAGAALADLHALPVRLGRRKRLPDHVRELIRPHPLRLAEAFPEHRDLIEATLAAIAAGERSWGGRGPVTPLHRDFHLRQLFGEAASSRGRGPRTPRVWVLDWDLYARGDPAFDVAYFMVYLQTHLDHHVDRAAAFLEGYGATRPVPSGGRLAVYAAFNYLRRACRRFRLRDRGWEVEMRAMLARCAGAL